MGVLSYINGVIILVGYRDITLAIDSMSMSNQDGFLYVYDIEFKLTVFVWIGNNSSVFSFELHDFLIF